MTRKRLIVLAAGVALWTAVAWLAVRGASSLWKRLGEGGAGARSAHAAPAAPGSRWTAREREAVERSVRAGYRAALPADAGATPERDDLEALYGAYDPFFVRGDLNGDGRQDFVQVFVREREGSALFDVAVFFGLPDGTYSPPVFVEQGIALGAGDVSVDRTLVIVTPDLAMDESYRYRFDPATRKFVDVDAAAGKGADDAPEQTPDQRLRVRV